MKTLGGQSALVTGGSRGLGLGVVELRAAGRITLETEFIIVGGQA